MVLTDERRALLGDKEAAKRVTEQGVLLGCPHCKGKAKVMARQNACHGQNGLGNKKLSWWIYVKCNKCHARSTPIKTKPIKLYSDHGYISEGSFYSTDWWQGEGRGLLAANKTFRPYVDAARLAWNTRAPVLSAEEIQKLEGNT